MCNFLMYNGLLLKLTQWTSTCFPRRNFESVERRMRKSQGLLNANSEDILLLLDVHGPRPPPLPTLTPPQSACKLHDISEDGGGGGYTWELNGELGGRCCTCSEWGRRARVASLTSNRSGSREERTAAAEKQSVPHHHHHHHAIALISISPATAGTPPRDGHAQGYELVGECLPSLPSHRKTCSHQPSCLLTGKIERRTFYDFPPQRGCSPGGTR